MAGITVSNSPAKAAAQLVSDALALGYSAIHLAGRARRLTAAERQAVQVSVQPLQLINEEG
jgi:hypothetical protein